MITTTMLPLATGGNQYLTIGLFLLVVALTLYITFWASRSNKTTTDYYAGGRSFSGFQNGLAIGGDYMSAASFLGISGAIALYGYDGFLYSIGFLVAWLVALLLIAELLRNSGRYTMADQLAYRMRQAPVRSAAATSTIVVSIFYLLAQMVGAGSLVGLLLGVDSPVIKNLVIVARRRPHDHLRHLRRDEGHHLGADRQGRAADGRHLVDHDPGARRVQLQPLRPARRRRGEDRQGRGVPAARPALRQGPGGQVRLPVAGSGPGAGHRRPPPHPDPLLHHAHRARRPQVGALGDRSDRRLLPDDPGARFRRRGAGRHRPRQPDRQVVGQPGLAAAGPGGRRWSRQSGWIRPAGVDLGRRLRHHPGGGRGSDPGVGLLGRP